MQCSYRSLVLPQHYVSERNITDASDTQVFTNNIINTNALSLYC